MLYLQQSVGIDLRDNTLRIVHLGRSFKQIVLIDYFVKKYPPAFTGKPGSEEEIDPLALDLRNFLRERRIKAEQIVVGLSKEKVILKEIILPRVDEKELTDLLAFEVGKHIPVEVDNIVFDYQILDKNDKSMRILLGIVKREDVNKILNLFEPEQMMPAVIDITSVASMNWLVSQNNIEDNNLITALVDIGEHTVEFGLLRGKNLRISRSISRAHHRLEDFYLTSVDSSSGLEAGRGGESNSGESIETKEGMALGQDIIRELGIALNVVDDHPEVEAINDLLICGLEAYESFASEYIAEHIEARIKILDPFRNISDKPIPGKISSSLTAANSLAMRGLEDQPVMFNFLPGGKKSGQKRNYIPVTITLVIMAVVLSLAWAAGLIYEKQLISTELMNSLKALQPDVTAVRDMSRELEKIDQEIATIEEVIKAEVNKMDILKDLTSILPADTWLDRLSLSNQKLEIDGYSEASSNLISILEVSPVLQSVQFASSINKLGPGKERFKIRAGIERGTLPTAVGEEEEKEAADGAGEEAGKVVELPEKAIVEEVAEKAVEGAGKAEGEAGNE